MSGKKVVKVYLPVPLAKIIKEMNRDNGISDSEIMRWAFTEYATSRNYLSGSLDPAELSDHPVQSTRDQAIINALKTSRDQGLIDWKIYENIGISDRDVLDFLLKYALKNEGLRIDQADIGLM
jgi:hypothetical protein